jgi:hypothetical protein
VGLYVRSVSNFVAASLKVSRFNATLLRAALKFRVLVVTSLLDTQTHSLRHYSDVRVRSDA